MDEISALVIISESLLPFDKILNRFDKKRSLYIIFDFESPEPSLRKLSLSETFWGMNCVINYFAKIH